jgi:HAD superfamily hydrolase (TIGR01509 family)
MAPNSPLKALIFDVDGTLADTERDGHRPAFNAAFEEVALGWHWDVDLYGELLAVTGGKERIRYYAEQYDPEFMAQPDAETVIRQLHAIKTRHYLAMLEAGRIPLRPGIAGLIAAARAAKLRLAVATTTTPENVTTLLQASLAGDAANWFEVIGAGDVVPHKKPAPDIYLWVLERLGLPPEACLAIEDSANGLKSAVAARIAVVVTPNAYTEKDSFDGARAVLPDLTKVGLAALELMHRIKTS